MLLPKISLKNKQILFRTLTVLISVFFILSGFLEITKHPATYPKTLSMGYPPYFITTLGIAKITGAILFVIPALRRLREWIFAAFTIDVIFAFVSGYMIQSYVDCVKAALTFIILMFTYRLFITIEKNKPR